MKSLGGRKLIIVILVVTFLGGAAAVFLLFPSVAGTVTAFGSSEADSHKPQHDEKEAPPEPGMMYPMKERIVNLADTGRLHYLKIELVLEFDLPDVKGLKGEGYKKRQEEFTEEMASRRPMMDDIVTTILANETWESISQPGGKEKLRENLKTRLGAVAGEHELLNVYFTQFVAQ